MTSYPKTALPAGHKISGYEVVRVIGRGGFGVVYEGRNPDTERHVAIKEFCPLAIATREGSTIVVNSDRDAEVFAFVLKRFRETAVLQYKFDHPNILKVLDYLRGENTGYMITEYVHGEPLNQFLQRSGGHFPSEQAFRNTMEQIVAAVRYLHERRHIHRDISPENSMIDKDGRAVLIDFGALKLDLQASQNYSSFVQYRPDYSPPEQQSPSRDRPEGFHTDIFALAGTMYFSLAGHPPARANARLLGDPYVPIAEASRIRCSPAVFAAIDQGLKLPVQERPQSIDAFVSMLAWTEPITVVSPSAVPAPMPQPEPAAASPPALPTPKPQPPPGPRAGWWFGYAATAAVLLFVLGILGYSFYEAPYCEQQARFDEAVAGGTAALGGYVNQCSGGRWASQARSRLEREAAGEALSCVARTTSCNFDSCRQAYFAEFPTGSRAGEITRAIAAKAEAPACRPCEQRANVQKAIGEGAPAVRAYLSQCANGPFASDARSALDKIVGDEALKCVADIPGCNVGICSEPYRREFPSGPRAAEIDRVIAARTSSEVCKPYCEQRERSREALAGGAAALRGYLNQCGGGRFSDEIRAALEKIVGDESMRCIADTAGCDVGICREPYRREFPSGPRAAEIDRAIAARTSSEACRPYCEQRPPLQSAVNGGAPALRAYLTQCGKGPFAPEADTALHKVVGDEALKCIADASGCNVGACQDIYRKEFPSGSRAAEIDRAIAAKTSSETCSPPHCEQRARLQDALAGGAPALRAYLNQCSSGLFTADARAALDKIVGDEAMRCVAHTSGCNVGICLEPYRREFAAGPRTADIEQAIAARTSSEICKPYCEQRAPHQNAINGDANAHRAYLNRCMSGPSAEDVERSLAALEGKLASRALECIQASCEVDACVRPYRSEFQWGRRADEIAAAARTKSSSDACRPYCQQQAPYQKAIGGDAAAHRAYLNLCTSGPNADDVQRRLNALENTVAIRALNCIQASCNVDACVRAYQGEFPFGGRAAEVARAATAKTSSDACRPYCEQQGPFQSAVNGSISALRAYLGQCSSGPNAAEVQRRLDAQEAGRVSQALTCVRTTTPCRFDSCKRIHADDFPSGSRTSEIELAITRELASPRCAPPPEVLALPNGTYQGTRGYDTARGTICLRSYPPFSVQVLNGSISFVSDDFNWEGTVNQRTGYINIPDERIRHLRTGDRSKQGLSISGDFRNAEITSGSCGKGIFRLAK
jgi:serine/threonine protein kinase